MSDELFEKACEAVHDAWAATKRAQGFHALSECRKGGWYSDSTGRRYPCVECHASLVPFVDLPESEKDLDRATVRAAVAPYVERIVELEAAAEASVQECARLREALDDNAESLRYEVDACAAQRERAERMRQLVARLAGVEAALADARANHVEERDELLHERELLVEVATVAQQNIDAIEAEAERMERKAHEKGQPHFCVKLIGLHPLVVQLRAALEAWTSDLASQRGEDEGRVDD